MDVTSINEPEVSDEEIEQRARKLLNRPREPIGETTLGKEYGGEFWNALQWFLEDPLVQELAFRVSASGGYADGQRRLRLILAVSDLLEASSDHHKRGEWTPLDYELANIVAGALNPDEKRHEAAMRMFEEWEPRDEAARLEEAREVVKFWIAEKRKKSQDKGMPIIEIVEGHVLDLPEEDKALI